VLRVSKQPGGLPEIFHSLQGEGPTIGTATVFLRLATCNLACTWCDTKYTWDWDHYRYDDEVISMETSSVRDSILAFDCPHLVITGGEPLLQQRDLTGLVAVVESRPPESKLTPKLTKGSAPAVEFCVLVQRLPQLDLGR